MPAKLTSHQILSTLARPTRPTPRLAPEGPRAAAQPLDPVAAQAANRAAVQALGRPAAAAPACRWRTTLTVTSRSCGSCRPCRSARRLGSGGNTASGPAAPTMASGSEVSGTAWEGRPGQTAPSTSASGGGTVQRAEAGSSMQTGTSTWKHRREPACLKDTGLQVRGWRMEGVCRKRIWHIPVWWENDLRWRLLGLPPGGIWHRGWR